MKRDKARRLILLVALRLCWNFFHLGDSFPNLFSHRLQWLCHAFK